MEGKEKVILRNLMDQAKYFLDEAGEFFPFGTSIDENGKMRPIGLILDDEHPTALQVISELESHIIQKIKSGEYICAGIGINVTVTSKDKKINAMRVQLYNETEKPVILEYAYYFSNDKKYYFQ